MCDSPLFRQPLLPNYTPDRWGYLLLHGREPQGGIYYSDSTDWRPPQKNLESDRKQTIVLIVEKTCK